MKNADAKVCGNNQPALSSDCLIIQAQGLPPAYRGISLQVIGLLSKSVKSVCQRFLFYTGRKGYFYYFQYCVSKVRKVFERKPVLMFANVLQIGVVIFNTK